jgi:small multidrug resistance pump
MRRLSQLLEPSDYRADDGPSDSVVRFRGQLVHNSRRHERLRPQHVSADLRSRGRVQHPLRSWASLFPRHFFDLFRLGSPQYPGIWACLGMVVGLYGVGYAYAAWRLDRAFPFIAIGLAGKILGPIGWVMSTSSGELPFRTFPLIVFDDLLWWTPFALFLLEGTEMTRFFKRTAPLWCAGLHAIAGVGTLMLLRGGSEAVTDVAQRVAYLSEHPARWRTGWLLWMLAAISLAGFYAWWGARITRNTALVAFSIASVGLLCDFSGESIFIGWMPSPLSPLYRAASLFSAAAGNGFYTIAAIVLTIRTPTLPLRPLAWLAWISGLGLTVATLAGVPLLVVSTSAALMATFIPWVAYLGVRWR